MASDDLSYIFDGYIKSVRQSHDISVRLGLFIVALLSSEFGSDLENQDGFSGDETERRITTVRTKNADAFDVVSEIVIEIFAEGRVRVSANWRSVSDENAHGDEVRVLHFNSLECSDVIAGRVLSCLADFQENDVSGAIRKLLSEMSHSMIFSGNSP